MSMTDIETEIEKNQDASQKLFDAKSPSPTSGKLLWLFCKLLVPCILTNFCEFFTMTVSMVFAGRMNDPNKLAAVGLSSLYINIIMDGFLSGLNRAQ